MTDEQRAALADALAPLQTIDWTHLDLDDLYRQASELQATICRIRGVFVTRGPKNIMVGDYQPSTEEQVAALMADAERIAQEFTDAAEGFYTWIRMRRRARRIGLGRGL